MKKIFTFFTIIILTSNIYGTSLTDAILKNMNTDSLNNSSLNKSHNSYKAKDFTHIAAL